MGLLLTIIARIAIWVLQPVMILTGTIITLFQHRSDRYYKDIAFELDVLMNVTFGPVLNIIMVSGKHYYPFGRKKETMSSAIGKNHKRGTSSKFGYWWYKDLDKLEKDHCENAVINDRID